MSDRTMFPFKKGGMEMEGMEQGGKANSKELTTVFH